MVRSTDLAQAGGHLQEVCKCDPNKCAKKLAINPLTYSTGVHRVLAVYSEVLLVASYWRR